MIRQIFIARIKDGVDDEMVDERIAAQQALKEHVAGILDITVGRALGFYGLSDAVVMTIDLADMSAWNNLLASDYHTRLGEQAGNYFDTDSFITAQVEL